MLVVYWDQRILVLSLYTTVFALGGALSLVVARVRARDNVHLTTLGIAGAFLSFALRVLREMSLRPRARGDLAQRRLALPPNRKRTSPYLGDLSSSAFNASFNRDNGGSR